MAPYAAMYVPPSDSATNPNEPPVIITMSLGSQDHEIQMMDIDDDTEEERVVRSALEDVRKQLVEMDDVQLITPVGNQHQSLGSTPLEGSGDGKVIVLDTNVLIRHLTLLRDLVEMVIGVQTLSTSTPVLLIPSIVLRELDGLKTQRRITSGGRELDSLARSATTFILETIEAQSKYARPTIRIQAPRESLRDPKQPHQRQDVGSNDDLVLDAAEYHKNRAVLLTDDKILLVKAHSSNMAAFSIDRTKATTARTLLALFEPQLAELAAEPVVRAATATPSSPYKKRSSSSKPITPLIPGSARKVDPIPLSVPPVPRHDSMELESDSPPPPRERPSAPPRPWPVVSPSDVFYNACDILAHLLAYDIYWHVFDHLRMTQPKEQHTWQEELGDWQHWDGAECIEVLKRWWEEGDLRKVCLKGIQMEMGLEKDKSAATPVVVEQVQPPPAVQPLIPNRNGSQSNSTGTRNLNSSRWAAEATSAKPMTGNSSKPALSGSNSIPLGRRNSSANASVTSISKAVPMSQSTKSTRSNITTTPLQKLQTFHQALARFLPGGHTSLRADPDAVNQWPEWRWELLCEGIEEVLAVVLGALLGDVREEVRGEVLRWTQDLKKVGLDVRI
ncbi:BQ2448_840 [Microbotryum intermedium]|uniref:BQ2448_840 protein n=1 Tax=Microbotryum intermedium TaxID=269621 RepID=A0A238F7I9_9BASI|nr:BQ2448_840 [Microbotryum intermedium]